MPARAGIFAQFTGLVVVALIVGGCWSSATPIPTRPPTPVPMPSVVRPSPSSTLADDSDEGDEGGSTLAPGASFTPGPTGIPASTPPGGSAARLPGEPDPALTPGALNPDVTQATIHSTVCASGWTATVRPPTSYTNSLKVKQIAQYGYADTKTSDYEEDHLISLELGGSPTDPRNLWPEPYTDSLADGRSTGAHTKDAFETKLKKEVCAGTLTLARAQSEIGDDWVHAYYGINP